MRLNELLEGDLWSGAELDETWIWVFGFLAQGRGHLAVKLHSNKSPEMYWGGTPVKSPVGSNMDSLHGLQFWIPYFLRATYCFLSHPELL